MEPASRVAELAKPSCSRTTRRLQGRFIHTHMSLVAPCFNRPNFYMYMDELRGGLDCSERSPSRSGPDAPRSRPRRISQQDVVRAKDDRVPPHISPHDPEIPTLARSNHLMHMICMAMETFSTKANN